MSHPLEIQIETGDITELAVDVIVLKFAREFHGADLAVANRLMEGGTAATTLRPEVGDRRLLPGLGRIAAKQALMVGTPSLAQFRYAAIRDFAFSSLLFLSREAPAASTIGLTIHGPGYGLDEGEALLSLVGGLIDALDQGHLPRALTRVVIVERNESRAFRLWQRLEGQYSERPGVARGAPNALRFGVATSPAPAPTPVEVPGTNSDAKPYAFVAMPFTRAMDDVYFFGIEQPVHAMGLLCERVDQGAFTGHILDQIRDRIENAAVVIADLTDANPNVYLEVGYAWGKGKPTILLVHDVKDLRFDVQSQRCLVYERILDLARLVTNELRRLEDRGIVRIGSTNGNTFGAKGPKAG